MMTELIISTARTQPRTSACKRKGAFRIDRNITFLAILFIAPFTLLPSAVAAGCAQWDVSGKWTVVTSSNPWLLDLRQDGTQFTGTISFNLAKGTVTGTMVGNDFKLQASFSRSQPPQHFFNGKVDSQGGIVGIYFPSSRDLREEWRSSRAMRCTDQLSTAPPAKKPARSGEVVILGRPKVPSGEPAAPVATTTSNGSARIFASPKAVAIPAGQKSGSTMVGWDAGPDHPYAEVWVSVDGGDPTRVVEQGKGTRRFTVEAGKTYRYILTDSGEELATATVKVQ